MRLLLHNVSISSLALKVMLYWLVCIFLLHKKKICIPAAATLFLSVLYTNITNITTFLSAVYYNSFKKHSWFQSPRVVQSPKYSISKFSLSVNSILFALYFLCMGIKGDIQIQLMAMRVSQFL